MLWDMKGAIALPMNQALHIPSHLAALTALRMAVMGSRLLALGGNPGVRSTVIIIHHLPEFPPLIRCATRLKIATEERKRTRL